MATRDELRAFLLEHYAYELLMLRYTVKRLDVETSQLEWNALFESCVTHARSLRDFLTNDKDNRNLRALDYGVEGIATRAESQGMFNSINEQIDHLSKQRPFDVAGGKMTLSDVKRAVAWIETKHAEFIAKCDQDLCVGWKDPSVPTQNLSTLSSVPSASSQPTAIGSASSSRPLSATGPSSDGGSSQ